MFVSSVLVMILLGGAGIGVASNIGKPAIVLRARPSRALVGFPENAKIEEEVKKEEREMILPVSRKTKLVLEYVQRCEIETSVLVEFNRNNFPYDFYESFTQERPGVYGDTLWLSSDMSKKTEGDEPISCRADFIEDNQLRGLLVKLNIPYSSLYKFKQKRIFYKGLVITYDAEHWLISEVNMAGCRIIANSENYVLERLIDVRIFAACANKKIPYLFMPVKPQMRAENVWPIHSIWIEQEDRPSYKDTELDHNGVNFQYMIQYGDAGSGTRQEVEQYFKIFMMPGKQLKATGLRAVSCTEDSISVTTTLEPTEFTIHVPGDE